MSRLRRRCPRDRNRKRRPLGGDTKLVAILSWYDERPSWLAGCVASLKLADVAHVVAVDGAYGLYPNGRGYSGLEQHAAITETCRALEMGVTIHAPPEPWFGNEVEKRTAAFRLADTVTEPGEDWVLIHDADHFVVRAFGHIRRLAETDLDVAAVRFVEKYDALESACPGRFLFRALPGMHYSGNHYTPRAFGVDLYRAPCLDLSCVEIQHRTRERDPYRKEAQQSYYRRRDDQRAEAQEVIAACA